MRARSDRALIVLIAGLSLALVAVVRAAIHQPVIEPGDTAPQFSFRADDGQTVSSTAFGGRLLILNFWASWCAPCIDEMPSLDALATELRKDGVVVAAVSIDANERPYSQFVQRLRPRFHTMRDPGGDIAASFGTFRIPETYVIDASGRVLQKYISNRNWMDSEMIGGIRALLR